MAGSSFGTLFQITTWGESHGAGIGVVVDGCPAGLSLSSSDIQVFLNRRKPGQTSYSTMRKEADEVEILSGVFEGHTTGVPISMLVRRGGGRSSGRETIGRVAGGAIASLLLKSLGIHIQAYTKAIGPYTIPEEEYDFSVLT